MSTTMHADATNIAGKVVVITGASSGLGEATARYLAERGAISSRTAAPYGLPLGLSTSAPSSRYPTSQHACRVAGAKTIVSRAARGAACDGPGPGWRAS